MKLANFNPDVNLQFYLYNHLAIIKMAKLRNFYQKLNLKRNI